MKNTNRLAVSLMLLRVSVFIVMLIWTLDKFVRPEHAGVVYEKFYHIPGMGPAVLAVIAALEMLIILGFAAGYQKKWTYGAVLVLHAISTIMSYKQYLAPFEGGNILFFAAWPMLAACFALYVLRDQDMMWVVDGQ
jgi:uncharacterized membrane protein YkgB